MKLKCFNVEVINYKDKTSGEPKTMYKAWFNLSSGIAWLSTSKPVQAGADLDVEFYPFHTSDTKTNMQLGVRIV